jgi:hypothetical protein
MPYFKLLGLDYWAGNKTERATLLSVILVIDHIDAQFLFVYFVYFNSLHVSSNLVLIIRRINCINTTIIELNISR